MGSRSRGASGRGARFRSSILSVREEEPDKIAALDLGADDYLTKPFGVGELLARVRALLRRADAAGDAHPPRYRLGDVEIDLGERRVRRDGGDVHLTKTEWALLETLSASAGKLLTHRWLLERVWGDGLRRRRGGPPGVRQPAPPQDRARPPAAASDRDRARDRLSMDGSSRGSRIGPRFEPSGVQARPQVHPCGDGRPRRTAPRRGRRAAPRRTPGRSSRSSDRAAAGADASRSGVAG